ncbi:MAG: hypothetical protein KME40_11485 [Komarekiella atlantica HA4396-MV6]|nr:hypothetical protein [Komarekiella atlantica HA4396-MV6]
MFNLGMRSPPVGRSPSRFFPIQEGNVPCHGFCHLRTGLSIAIAEGLSFAYRSHTGILNKLECKFQG